MEPAGCVAVRAAPNNWPGWSTWGFFNQPNIGDLTMKNGDLSNKSMDLTINNADLSNKSWVLQWFQHEKLESLKWYSGFCEK